MPKRLTQNQKNIITTSIAAGDLPITAARKAKCQPSTLSQNKSLMNDGDIIKKELHDKIKADLINDSVAMVKAMRQPIMDAIAAITPAAIAKQSASANATSAAILIDKIQLLTGGATETIDIRDGSGLLDSLSAKYKTKLKNKPVM